MQVKTKNLTLETVTHGDKKNPCMILVRGLGSQLVQWNDNFIQGFVDNGYYVVTFDNRDIGLSQRIEGFNLEQTEASIKMLLGGNDAPAPYSVVDMADDVIDLMDAMTIEKAHVYGVSLGGIITQLLAHNYPDRFITSTIVMSTNGKAGLSDMSDKMQSVMLQKIDPKTPEDMANILVGKSKLTGSPKFPVSDEIAKQEALSLIKRGYDTAGEARQLLAILKGRALVDMVAYNKETKIPCLVLHGNEDPLVGVDHGRSIAEHIPNAEFKSWDGWGHDNPPEMSAPIIEEFLRFIKSKSISSDA